MDRVSLILKGLEKRDFGLDFWICIFKVRYIKRWLRRCHLTPLEEERHKVQGVNDIQIIFGYIPNTLSSHSIV